MFVKEKIQKKAKEAGVGNVFSSDFANKITKQQLLKLAKTHSKSNLIGKRAPSAELDQKLIDELDKEGPEVKTLCETYGLKREELGRLTGFSVRALADWAAAKLPSQPAQRRLREIQRLLDALAEIVKPSAIPHWLHKQNTAFEGMTPLQVIEVGEIDRLWSMIHEIASGQQE